MTQMTRVETIEILQDHKKEWEEIRLSRRKAMENGEYDVKQYVKDYARGSIYIDALTFALSDMEKVERLEKELDKIKCLKSPESIRQMAFDRWHDVLQEKSIEISALKADNAKLKEEIDHLRIQLAGCGVAALGYAKDNNDCKKGGYGWSASFQDVKDLWEKYAKLTQELNTHKEAAAHFETELFYEKKKTELLTERIKKLEGMCKMFLSHLESGVLVRDISKDGDANWAMNMLSLVRDLRKAQQVIAQSALEGKK